MTGFLCARMKVLPWAVFSRGEKMFVRMENRFHRLTFDVLSSDKIAAKMWAGTWTSAQACLSKRLGHRFVLILEGTWCRLCGVAFGELEESVEDAPYTFLFRETYNIILLDNALQMIVFIDSGIERGGKRFKMITMCSKEEILATVTFCFEIWCMFNL